MGCKLCKKEIQIIEPESSEEPEKLTPEEVEIEEIVPIDPLQFDFKKAQKLVQLLLSEDYLYKKSLEPILLFNEEQLENLFMGNDEYKDYPYYLITDKIQFKNLLLKFEDFNNFLFEWYRDESKYDNLIKLWKSSLCLYKLKDRSDGELEDKFREAGINDIDEFMVDFRVINNNSIESKSSDISNYLKDQYDDFYSLITTSMDYKNDNYLSKSENNGIFTNNFKNIIEKLVKSSFPLVKNYINEKYPNLNIISKLQLKGEMLNKLKNSIVKKTEDVNRYNSGGTGFDRVKNLINAIKNGKSISHLKNELNVHFNNPKVAIVNLAMSFINLATSIKTYYNNSVEFDDKTQNFKQKINEINEDFEYHKKQIGLLDLDNYEECLNKIKTIGKKIQQDKLKVIEFVKNIDNEEKNLEKDKKKSGVKTAVTCGVGILGSAIGFVATGGILAGVYAVAAVANGIAMGINIANIIKIKKQLEVYKDFKEQENQKYEDIENTLAELQFKYNKLEERYIPINLK